MHETDDAGVYRMCRKDYPDVLAELEKEDFTDLLDCGCGTAPMLTLLKKYPFKAWEAMKNPKIFHGNAFGFSSI